MGPGHRGHRERAAPRRAGAPGSTAHGRGVKTSENSGPAVEIHAPRSVGQVSRAVARAPRCRRPIPGGTDMGLTWPAGHRQARQLSRPGPSRQWALVLTSAAFFMVALDALVVITALPTIHRDLGGSVS